MTVAVVRGDDGAMPNTPTYELCLDTPTDLWTMDLAGDETLMAYVNEELTDEERQALCGLPDGVATALRNLVRWAQRTIDCPE